MEDIPQSSEATDETNSDETLFVAENRDLSETDGKDTQQGEINQSETTVVEGQSNPAVRENNDIELLAELSYELVPAVDHAEKLIRDAKDQPILNAAIVSDVDVILTGDKDFLSLDMEHPKPMTVTQFLAAEGLEE